MLIKNNINHQPKYRASSAIIVHETKRTATSTRTSHTRQNKPSRPGVVWAGVVGARGRCCRSCRGTKPLSSSDGARSCIAEIALKKQNSLRCRCCIAEIANKKQHKIINPSTELALPSSSTKRSAQQRVREQHTRGRTSLPGLAWCGQE